MSDLLFWSTLILLSASTIWTVWRMRGQVTAAVVVPLAWIVLIPIPVILRPYGTPTGLFPQGFVGDPKNAMYTSIALANIAFFLFQVMVSGGWFKHLQQRVVGFFEVPSEKAKSESSSLLKKWVLVLSLIAIALAVIHLALMPRVPAWDLVTGFVDPLQPNYDREAADKFLPVPTFIRYVFDWNQGIFFPILFTATIVMRWRPMAIVVGIFGFIYVTSTLEKFPSLLFIAGPFIAIAVRDSRPIWSRVVIAGLLLGLLGPLAVSQAPSISTSVHDALRITPAAAPPIDNSITTPVPGCEAAAPVNTASSPFSWRDIPGAVKNILVHRIGVIPAEVTYGWFAYFPAQHPFLNGSGWEPWNVLRSSYRNPANLVGLWMYCGHAVTLPTVSAYGSFIADGWGEFGYLGVLIACLGYLLFGIVLELIRGFISRPFCLALYGPSLLLFASLPSRAGLLATVVSSGLWMVPVLCVLFLASERIGTRRRVNGIPALEGAGS
jgi:hypothetical protein